MDTEILTVADNSGIKQVAGAAEAEESSLKVVTGEEFSLIALTGDKL